MSPLLRQSLHPGFGSHVRIKAAPLRIALWLVVLVFLLRCLTRLLAWLILHPRATATLAAAGGVAWLVHRYGWELVVTITLVVLLALLAWAWLHEPSWNRWVEFPARSRWRRFWTYRRWWQPAMVTAGIVRESPMGHLLPDLVRVKSTAEVDMVTARMLPGQTVADWIAVAPRLAQTFGVRQVRVYAVAGQEHLVALWCLVHDPLAKPVPVIAPPDVVDLAAIPVGRREDGQPFTLPVIYSHLLVGGETGSGKGSVLWSLLVGLAPAIRSRLVRIWAIDPKGGMELGMGAPLFEQFAFGQARPGIAWQEDMAQLLEAAVQGMQARAARLRAAGVRKHVPTPDDPLHVVLVDELAALTAYVTDTALRRRLEAALSLLLSQGRAVGVVVIGATQDVRKETLAMRDLFPTRVALRASEPTHADMVLGGGARARGALTDRIPDATPGVGYVVVDDAPEPVRVRFSHVTDQAILDVTNRYAPTVETTR